MTEFILPAEISLCAFWMCDMMETVSAETVHFSFNTFQSRICPLWAADASLSVYLKSHVWNENHQNALSATLQGQKLLCSTTYLVVSTRLGQLFSCRDVKSNCKAFFSPHSLNGVPRLSFQPVFSLGSLPGKQKKYLNQWKMCLTVFGSSAPLCPAILKKYKTLQAHQLETTDQTTTMSEE